MADWQGLYDELIRELRDTALLSSCGSVLSWDEQTNMPPEGTELRADQLALLAGLVHDRNTAPRMGELLLELSTHDLGPEDGAVAVNVREARRDYELATRLPRSLVQELSRVATLAQQAWIDARKKDDFGLFRPWLEKTIALKRQEAAALGYAEGGVPYDALLDQYEPGATTAQVTAVFTALRKELVPLVASIHESAVQPDISILERSYPVAAQQEFGQAAARAIGFDFQSGRLDIAAHPFCSGFGPGDCRLTTRYNEHHFPGAFFGTLHESGHGIYEQGLDRSAFGTPMGQSVSLGIHESQSRMWENFVGRSHAFWRHFYPLAQSAFPEALANVSLEEFHRAVNDVRPSLIRVEADEVTYNLHIMLRFELEQALISGDLDPADVPDVWNSKFEEYFGIVPESDANGCLQDIHWSAGLLGYFPTYALGNMYAAQFFAAARQQLGDLDEQFACGEFTPLKEWLGRNIHMRGKQYRAHELVKVVTGAPLSHEALMTHLHERFDPLYGL